MPEGLPRLPLKYGKSGYNAKGPAAAVRSVMRGGEGLC